MINRNEIKNKLFAYIGNNECYEFILVGILCSFDEYFVPSLIEECKKSNILIKEDHNAFTLLEELKIYKKIKNDIFFITYNDSILLQENEIIVGCSLHTFNESKSIKRIKIEVYNDLQTLGLLYRNTDLEYIRLFPEIVLYDKEK